MTPEIISREEFIVVGVRTVFEHSAQDTRTFWKDKFLPRHNELTGADRKYYAVFSALPDDTLDGRYEYVAGVVTNSLEDIPIGMVGWVIPAGKYAEIEGIGRSGISRICQRMISAWLPGSGYEMVQSPMFAYTSDPHPDGEQAVWKVNIPVETPEVLAQLESWLNP